MATIKQVLAAISQDGTLGPNQKRFVTGAIQRAETWCQLQTGPKPHKITNTKNLKTLPEWEATHGTLDSYCFVNWIKEKGFCENVIKEMLEEFKGDMTAKGKQYADFCAAFKTYLTKGYLSKKLTECVKPAYSGTIIQRKGISL